MASLSVGLNIDGAGGIISIDLRDILFLKCNSYESQSILVYTKSGVYYILGPMRYWVKALNSSGCKLSITDRGTAVNVDNVTRLDRVLKTAYFKMDVESSLHCTIAFQRYRKIEQELLCINPGIVVT